MLCSLGCTSSVLRTKMFNDTPYGPAQFGVGDVAAVPRQQVLATINGGDRNVSSQFEYLATERQSWYISKEFQTVAGEKGVSCSYFLSHKLRNVQLELGATRSPPIARNILMGGDQEIAARPPDQIARNRCFEV